MANIKRREIFLISLGFTVYATKVRQTLLHHPFGTFPLFATALQSAESDAAKGQKRPFQHKKNKKPAFFLTTTWTSEGFFRIFAT